MTSTGKRAPLNRPWGSPSLSLAFFQVGEPSTHGEADLQPPLGGRKDGLGPGHPTTHGRWRRRPLLWRQSHDGERGKADRGGRPPKTVERADSTEVELGLTENPQRGSGRSPRSSRKTAEPKMAANLRPVVAPRRPEAHAQSVGPGPERRARTCAQRFRPRVEAAGSARSAARRPSSKRPYSLVSQEQAKAWIRAF